MKKIAFYIAFISICTFLAGCSTADYDNHFYDYYSLRLVIQGTVVNDEGQPLEGIKVSIYGVREEGEEDIASYNYAVTDAQGNYIIMRYMGRNPLPDFYVVASDPNGKYYDQEAPPSSRAENLSTSADVTSYHIDFVLMQKP